MNVYIHNISGRKYTDILYRTYASHNLDRFRAVRVYLAKRAYIYIYIHRYLLTLKYVFERRGYPRIYVRWCE